MKATQFFTSPGTVHRRLAQAHEAEGDVLVHPVGGQLEAVLAPELVRDQGLRLLQDVLHPPLRAGGHTAGAGRWNGAPAAAGRAGLGTRSSSSVSVMNMELRRFHAAGYRRASS